MREECGSHAESFATRVRFTTKEAKLSKSLKKLTESNILLKRLVDSAAAAPAAAIVPSRATQPAPSRKVSEVARNIYDSLALLLACNCAARHEARLCVNVPYSPGPESVATKLDMFVSILSDRESISWQDSSVHLDIDV